MKEEAAEVIAILVNKTGFLTDRPFITLDRGRTGIIKIILRVARVGYP